MEEKFISADLIHDAFRYNFEHWSNAMQKVEPIVPEELELVEGQDYVYSPGLKLSFSGAQKIKTFIHLKQLVDIKDWFESRPV